MKSSRKDVPTAPPDGPEMANLVIADLEKAEEHALSLRQHFTRQSEALAKAQAELTKYRLEVERQHARAEGFRKALLDIQRATFSGNVHTLVLQSCISLTGASRGIYLAFNGTMFVVKANVGVFGSVLGHPPTPYMDALGRRVLDRNDAVVAGDCDALNLPEPAEGERFRNCAAIPVAMQGNQRGVLIVADKQVGDFDEADLEVLLHVGDQAVVAVDNAQLQHDLEEVYLGTVGMLADAVQTKDPYTRGHCEDVARLAYAMAVALDLDEMERETVCLAALLHDIGKICISDGLLNKPGPLLPEEREVLKAHARIGADLMRSLPALSPVSDVVLHHHEHFDGKGYPDGLAGEAIPMGSRIVAVLDAYSAMIDHRSYKAALGTEETRAELKRCAGTQFDPRLVDIFLGVLDAGADKAIPQDRIGWGLVPHVRRHHEARRQA